MQKIPMTAEGHKALDEELKHLKSVERPAVIAAISEAREHGDLSENAEYHAAKERQSHIAGQIASLEDKLARAQVIDPPDRPPDNVQFGVTVLLSDSDSGDEITYTIVGDDEANPNQGRISLSSPVARALINKRVDETVIVRAPKGDRELEILEITFDPAVPDSTS